MRAKGVVKYPNLFDVAELERNNRKVIQLTNSLYMDNTSRDIYERENVPSSRIHKKQIICADLTLVGAIEHAKLLGEKPQDFLAKYNERTMVQL